MNVFSASSRLLRQVVGKGNFGLLLSRLACCCAYQNFHSEYFFLIWIDSTYLRNFIFLTICIYFQSVRYLVTRPLRVIGLHRDLSREDLKYKATLNLISQLDELWSFHIYYIQQNYIDGWSMAYGELFFGVEGSQELYG